MRDVAAELKELRLHDDMAGADLTSKLSMLSSF